MPGRPALSPACARWGCSERAVRGATVRDAYSGYRYQLLLCKEHADELQRRAPKSLLIRVERWVSLASGMHGRPTPDA